MTRLVLRTGRFRNMGYETAFSGSAPTRETKAQAEQLLSTLRSGSPKGEIGIVEKVTAAGRGVEETLALMLPRPLSKQSETRLTAESYSLHRNDLPALLSAAQNATSVGDARAVLRHGLDKWMVRLEPNVVFAPDQDVDKPAARFRTRGPIMARYGLASLLVLMFAVGCLLWLTAPVSEKQIAPNTDEIATVRPVTDAEPVPDGNDASQPTGDEGENSGQSEVDARLRARFSQGEMTDDAVIQKRRAISGVVQDLKAIRDAIGMEAVELASDDRREIGESSVLQALIEIRKLELPTDEALCASGADACPPRFSVTDEHVLAIASEAYKKLWLKFVQTEQGEIIDPLRSKDDAVSYGEKMVFAGFRPKEINLRGELHRLGLGEEAGSLIDPLMKLIDCPTPSQCSAPAALAIALGQ